MFSRNYLTNLLLTLKVLKQISNFTVSNSSSGTPVEKFSNAFSWNRKKTLVWYGLSNHESLKLLTETGAVFPTWTGIEQFKLIMALKAYVQRLSLLENCLWITLPTRKKKQNKAKQSKTKEIRKIIPPHQIYTLDSYFEVFSTLTLTSYSPDLQSRHFRHRATHSRYLKE